MRPSIAAALILERADLEPLARGETVESPDGGTLRADPEAADALRRALAIDLAPPVFTEEVIAAFNEGAERLRASKPADCLDMRPAPKPARLPKNGDQLGTFDVDALDALPEGSAFEPATAGPTITKRDGRWWLGDNTRDGWSSRDLLRIGHVGRTLKLPEAARTPKTGDRLDSFTAAELDALPVGARFELDGYDPIERMAGGWRKRDIEPYTINVGFGDFGDRTLVLPEPKVVKVGDRLRDLTPEQRADLPVGTALGCNLSSQWTVTKSADGLWRDTVHPEPCHTDYLNLDRTIQSLPSVPKPAKVGDRWGDLTPEQRRALPVGTVLAPAERAVPHVPHVILGADGLWHGSGCPLKTLVPNRTIAFIPPTPESK